MKVEELLGREQVEYDLIPHRETYDAQRMAETVHVSGNEVAKTVLLRKNGSYVVAVLPANRVIDFEMAANTLEADHVELATELEMKEQCPDCEIGALPPFGSMYGMKTIVDESLLKDETIVFEGNTHSESIRMKCADFCRIEKPQIGRIAP